MKKKIGFWDLVFMNVSALFGIRWLAKSTSESFGLGLGAIPIWIVYSFIFFVPSALICAELASTYTKKDGGLYDWVKEAYGEKYGFLVAWLNWTAKIFWYSSFLTFFTVNISFAIGKRDLANNQTFVLIFSLIIFGILSYISTKGMTFGKLFTNIGALGSLVPATLLILLTFISIFIKGTPSASTFTISTLTPKLNPSSLAAISSIMFALSGAEITANFITEIDDSSKTFPRAIFAAAGIVGSLYVIGSIAITLILPTYTITASKGVLDALGKVSSQLGIGEWLVQLIALSISVSIFGAIILYIVSPIKMLFGSVPKGIFSNSLINENKYKIPVKAIYLQYIIVALILLVTNLIPSVESVYNVLVTMTALTSLFPYILLFGAYIKLRKNRPNEVRPYTIAKNNNIAICIGMLVLIVTVIGIILSAAPTYDTFKDNLIYELEMIFGSVVVIFVGLLLWKKYENSENIKNHKKH